MRTLIPIAAGIAIAGAGLTLGPTSAWSQATASPLTTTKHCLSCTESWNGSEWTCTTDPAEQGFNSCSCPCSCSGACGTSALISMRALRDHRTIPASGARLRATDVKFVLAASPEPALLHGRRSANVFFLPHYGIMKYNDGTWRVFPLESENTFVVRDCQGHFLARAYRLSAITTLSDARALAGM